MSAYQSILSEALELDPEERELLLVRLAMSLDAEQPDSLEDPELLAELDRRSRDIDSGAEVLLDWDEAKARIFGS